MFKNVFVNDTKPQDGQKNYRASNDKVFEIKMYTAVYLSVFLLLLLYILKVNSSAKKINTIMANIKNKQWQNLMLSC